jgi:hypothetical protein
MIPVTGGHCDCSPRAPKNLATPLVTVFYVLCTFEYERTINAFQPEQKNIFFPIVQQPLVGHGLLITEASRSHSDTPHSTGLLWTGDQPIAETCT